MVKKELKIEKEKKAKRQKIKQRIERWYGPAFDIDKMVAYEIKYIPGGLFGRGNKTKEDINDIVLIHYHCRFNPLFAGVMIRTAPEHDELEEKKYVQEGHVFFVSDDASLLHKSGYKPNISCKRKLERLELEELLDKANAKLQEVKQKDYEKTLKENFL